MDKLMFKKGRVFSRDIANEEDKGFDIRNIEKETIENKDFRRVLYTAKNEQLVLMSIDVGDDIGMETHGNVDQFFRIEEGEGKLVIEGKGEFPVASGSSILVKQGTAHNIVNTGNKSLKLYTIYSPPNHPPDKVQATKKSATRTGDLDVSQVTLQMVKGARFGCNSCLWYGVECKNFEKFKPEVTRSGEPTCKEYVYYD
ncbi:MAG: cupin domain-containing protein [Methanosarcina sp.]|nr:cupin domain-containing protein [Methanosarcina sp.]